MNRLRQFSFILVAFFLWAALTYFFWQVGNLPIGVRIISPIVFAFAILGVWMVIRPTGTVGLRSTSDIERMIGDGIPAVLEFYSEY